MNNLIRFLLFPITWLVRQGTRGVSHFFTHPNGGLHLAIFVESIVIIAMGIWIGSQVISSGKKGGLSPKFPKVPVEAGPVKIDTFEQFVTAVGTLRSNQSIILKPEIDGKVREVFVKSGQKVTKGDKLLRLDSDLYKAQLKEAKAQLVNARSAHKRAEMLFKRKAMSEKDKEEYYAKFLIAEAAVDRAQAQLSKTTLYAPFEGYLGIVDVSLGRYLKSGEDLFTIDDTDPIKVDFRVGEVLLSKLHIGDEVSIEVDGFEKNTYWAKIEAIDTNVDPLGHSLRIQASFENIDGELRPGLFAKVRLKTERHPDAMMVPESAVESRGKQEYVYTISKGVAKMTPIKTGARNGEYVEVTKGLTPKDQVVYTGQMKVQHGYPVMVVPSRSLGR